MDQEVINFKIERMDGLGQGFSTEGGTTFILKVLPGEEGTAVIYRRAKGVRFAAAKEITAASKSRIQPECSLYEECGGCQFLHTTYENEIKYKREYLGMLFNTFLNSNTTLRIYPAPDRFGYRNRIQLHYNRKNGTLGYVSTFSHRIISASRCILPTQSVAIAIHKLYSEDSWKTLLSPSSPDSGTIEIYHRPGEKSPVISINTSYAKGGFTQVNETMNTVLTSLTAETFSRCFGSTESVQVLDVFGGNGNLTSSFPKARITVIDTTLEQKTNKRQRRPFQFIRQDLFQRDAVKKLHGKLAALQCASPHLIVFDPPRKGVKNISEWITYFSPDFIFYISCNPATLKRDTETIAARYQLSHMALVDLFPGTKHFETFVVFKKILPSTDPSESGIV